LGRTVLKAGTLSEQFRFIDLEQAECRFLEATVWKRDKWCPKSSQGNVENEEELS
jgi:hypothetical protein